MLSKKQVSKKNFINDTGEVSWRAIWKEIAQISPW